jgi:hypothetical protein
MLLDSGGYSDLLGAERSRGEIFSAVQTRPEAHPASCTKRTVSFVTVKGLKPTTHFLLVPGWEWVGAILPPILVACIAIS